MDTLRGWMSGCARDSAGGEEMMVVCAAYNEIRIMAVYLYEN